MASLQKDIDIAANVGGALIHWTNVAEEGGGLMMYNTRGVGQLPSSDFSTQQREALSYTVATHIVGATPEEQATYRERFANGQVFDAKAQPNSDGDMRIMNRPEAVGRRFVVSNALATTAAATGTEGTMTELTITLTEVGATPA